MSVAYDPDHNSFINKPPRSFEVRNTIKSGPLSTESCGPDPEVPIPR